MPLILYQQLQKISQSSLYLTVASISVTRVTKGSKSRISTTRWYHRPKTPPKGPPQIQNVNFW